MPHDQLFKELLRVFFAEFLSLFFPDITRRLDFASVEFLEQEVFTDFPEGDARRTDTLAQVNTRDGDPEVVLFHIETEAVRRNDFRFRMWEYYSMLRRRTKKPIFPIVIYLSPGTGGIMPEDYSESVLGYETLRFIYQAVGLPDLNADDYLEGDNLVGVALSSLMKRSQFGVVLQKWSALRKILTSGLDESGKILLSNVVENYLPLSDEQQSEYSALWEREAVEEIKEMISIYELRGIEQGIEQGILAGMRRTILRQLEVRFGTVSDSIRATVEGISDRDHLESLSIAVLTTPSVEALFQE